MGELIPFPVIKKQAPSPEVSDKNLSDVSDSNNSNVLVFQRKFDVQVQRKAVQACFFEGSPKISLGGEVVVNVYGKNHKGQVTAILKRDDNNNVTKIAYIIPFLSGEDPFKFGEADFKYKVETYD